jgi:hypothetical protein
MKVNGDSLEWMPDGKRWILIVSFLGCIQGKSVVNLVGRHGNAGAGEVAAVAMGFCLVAWKLDNSPR